MAQQTFTLQGDAKLIFDYLMMQPGQKATMAEIAKATGVSSNTVRWMPARLKSWLNEFRMKKKGDVLQIAYVAPKAPLEGTIINVVAPTASGDGKKKKGDDSPAVEANNSAKAAQLIWPAAPAIPDVNSSYGWFMEPPFYKHLKSKVLTWNLNCRFQGPPGIGKSSAVEVLAAENFVPLVNIGAESGLRLRQLVGGLTDRGAFEVAQFAAAVVNGWWAKIDEANAMDPDAALALNAITAPPYILTIAGKSYPVNPGFRLFITYNHGLIGTKPLPDSLKDRLYPFVVEFPDPTTLAKMLKSNGVDTDKPEGKSIVELGAAIADARLKGGHRYDVTLRRLKDMWADVQDGLSPYKAAQFSIVNGIDDVRDRTAVKLICDELKKNGKLF